MINNCCENFIKDKETNEERRLLQLEQIDGSDKLFLTCTRKKIKGILSNGDPYSSIEDYNYKILENNKNCHPAFWKIDEKITEIEIKGIRYTITKDTLYFE